ncbi:immunoglobulin kappa light chain-like isoform X1 [Onychostoma macrolepis]|uniref:immunoglobulin kappa light chain-like isoform X1 n=1 Tax=Onychostoma macrolepis TaxID=369639 RepID=UPI00272C1F3D|nr:immunoglobulin kappa light chain-like isoform X1 [Onychostoma macrolepis]
MALSGIITFGLFVALIDCLNGQITHPDPVLIRARTKAALIKCQVDSATFKSSALHWYRALPKGALQRLIYFEAGSKTFKKDPDAPRKTGLSGSVNDAEKDKPVTLTLTITRLEPSDAGSYYCALWSGDKKVFGSGTRLYVTDKAIKAPTLSRYLPSEKDKSDKHGKKTLLIQASDMFPDLVKFVWKRKDGEKWTDVSEGEVLEQRNGSPAVTVTSMLIVDKDKAKNDYQCTVTHEGNTAGTKTLEMKEENSKPTKGPTDGDQNSVTCPPSTEEPITNQISGDSEQIPSMFLFVYAYAVLLMKNGLFFSVVSIFLLKRKVGRKDKSSKT